MVLSTHRQLHYIEIMWLKSDLFHLLEISFIFSLRFNLSFLSLTLSLSLSFSFFLSLSLSCGTLFFHESPYEFPRGRNRIHHSNLTAEKCPRSSQTETQKGSRFCTFGDICFQSVVQFDPFHSYSGFISIEGNQITLANLKFELTRAWALIVTFWYGELILNDSKYSLFISLVTTNVSLIRLPLEKETK